MKRMSSPSPPCSTHRSTPFALTIATGPSLERRPPLGPRKLPLDGGADPERLVVAETARDDLEPDGKPFVGPPGGDAEGGALAHEVEHARHVEAVVEAVSAVRVPDELVLVDRPGRLRHRRAEERIEVLEHPCELLPGLRANELEALEVDGTDAQARIHESNDPRIHLLPKRAELVAEDRRQVDPPVIHPGVGDLPPPAKVDLLDDCPSACERV